MTTVRAYCVPVAFFLLLTMPVFGQFKETYAPPGHIFDWGSNGSGDGQFSLPRGVAVDASGNIYVADTSNHRIQKFDSDGNYLTQWGSFNSGDILFYYPYAVATDNLGNVYVADTNHHSIQKFDSDGNYLTQWGGYGNLNGQFQSAVDVAADHSGNVYVVDRGNDRIQKFDSDGNYLDQWGGLGTGEGQLWSPYGVDTDAAGNVYVADTGNYRIQKFDSDGNYLTQWGGFGTGLFNAPCGIAVDASGNIYVSDSSDDRIQKFTSAGEYLTQWGSTGTGDGEFDYPHGVAADAWGNIYIAERNNYRIQKFAPALWFDMAGYEAHLSVETLHETTAVRTLLQLENNGAPRFAFKNTNSGIEWSFQQSGPGNFLISKEGTGGPEMQVYGSGMVRMGPGGANNFTLSAGGNLTIAGSLTANGSTFPDYVFEPGYSLMPLPDLRTYIEQEKRLPDIPSADEVQQQGGHNMTELQLKLLEKIEELTLYTLEQEAEIQEVKRENTRMKAANAKMAARLAAIEALLSDR